MSASWLQEYLVEAVQRKLCTQIGCTTCGALEFRRGVLAGLERATGQPAVHRFGRVSAVEIAKFLTAVMPVKDESIDLEPAVRCLLYDLWNSNRDIEAVIAGTWAGKVLAAMKEHHRARVAAHLAHEEFQGASQGRREERKRLRQQQHQARLALKIERDRLWRERQAKD